MSDTERPPIDHFVITEEYAGTPLHTLRLSLREQSFFYSRSGSVVMGPFHPSGKVADWMERHALAIAEFNGRIDRSRGTRRLTVTIQRGEDKFEASFSFDDRDRLPPPVATLHGEYHETGRLVAESHDPYTGQRLPEVEGERSKPWWKVW